MDEAQPKRRLFQFTVRDLLWLLGVIALVLAWRIDRSRVPQWEYQFKQIDTMTSGVKEREIAALGAEGWEVVFVNLGGRWSDVWLKRPKR